MAVLAQGVDYAFSHPSIPSLVAGGYSFAVRYLYPFSQNPGTKNLTRPEADRLNTALLHGVVSNFESYANRAAEGFAAGVADAKNADAQHRACGGPPGRPIYFSVDFDPTPNQYPGIGAYFRGVASVIGLARTGAYGSYAVVKWLFDQGLIYLDPVTVKGWGWQTYAWSGGQYDERCALSQDKNGVPMGGGEVDLDSAHAEDFGQWNYTETPGGDDMSDADVKAILSGIDHRLSRVLMTLMTGKPNSYVNPAWDSPASPPFAAGTDLYKFAFEPGASSLNELALALSQRARLVKAPGASAIFYGDHIVRRWVDDPVELVGLQKHLRAAGLDATVYTLAPGEQLEEWGALVGRDPSPERHDAPPPAAPA